jgi:hypothetical protein
MRKTFKWYCYNSIFCMCGNSAQNCYIFWLNFKGEKRLYACRRKLADMQLTDILLFTNSESNYDKSRSRNRISLFATVFRLALGPTIQWVQKLSVHSCLVLRLRKHKALHPLCLYAFQDVVVGQRDNIYLNSERANSYCLLYT